MVCKILQSKYCCLNFTQINTTDIIYIIAVMEIELKRYHDFNNEDIILTFIIKLMNGKAMRKHNPHGKIAASVLLKPFISR